MPRPDSGFLSGVLAGINQFKQTKQFYEQMESTNLQQEATRAQMAAFKQQQADYMSPDEKALWERDQLGPNAVAQGAAGVAAAPYTVRANNIGTQGQIDFNKGLGTPDAQPGQVGQYDPYTGKTSLVDDPGYGVIPSWEAEQIFKDQPNMSAYFTVQPVPGQGKNMVKFVPKPRGSGSGYGSPGMEMGRVTRAMSELNKQLYYVTDTINAEKQGEWNAGAEADPESYEGMAFKGVNPSDVHTSTYNELVEEWAQNGTVAPAKLKKYLRADYKLLGPESINRLWVIALSQKNYPAFRELQVALREMYESGMNEKQIDDYLRAKQAQFPEVQYQPYETLQTSPRQGGGLETERNTAAQQYGPLRNE